jgi:tRNA-(ms[2]io[6]A)-hydroxylase
MVEARSCERFKVLAEHMEDPELVQFYTNLMKSEAQHYTVFLSFARKYAGREVADARWQEMLTFETELIRNYGRSAGIHG